MLFSDYTLKGRKIKNRIVFPPVVCPGFGDNHYISDKNLEHYKNVLNGGAGFIETEALCIEETARLNPDQLGIWNDSFIDGLAKLTKLCHDQGVPIVAQIHHAGMQSVPGPKKVPSALTGSDGSVRGETLTKDEIKKIEQQFIDAAIRAKKAGFDGVEIHGAHTYLLSYFLSDKTNLREDEYGGGVENRARLVLDIIKDIRSECGDDFIIGIRYGGASTSLEDGIAFSKMFEDAGCDFLHVSWGASPRDTVPVPQEYSDFNSYLYTAIEVKKNVGIPVIAVNSIDTPELARKLVDGGLVDFVALARPILADYNWPNKIKNGEPVDECLYCRPRCRWFDGALIHCPARKQGK